MKIAKFIKLKFDPEAERRARAPAVDQWRAEYPNLSTAHDAVISFGRGGPIDPADVERIVRGYPQRRGKGRGENRDALARSPTGGGKFADGGEGDWSAHQSATLFDGDSATYHTKGLDDADPKGGNHMQSLHNRWGEGGRVQDARFPDKSASPDKASDDNVEPPQDHDLMHECREDDASGDQNPPHVSKIAKGDEFIGEIDDDEEDEDEIYLHDDYEQQEIDEDAQLIREYARLGGAATRGDQSGYPLLDAMRALGLSLVRGSYLQLHCRLNYGTKPPAAPLSEEELPPMFRRPPRTRIE